MASILKVWTLTTNMIIKIIAWGIFIAFFWLIIVSLYAFYIYTHPPRYVSSYTPSDLGLSYESVRFGTSDGLTLAGWYIPSPQNDVSVPAVICCHGYPFDKGNILGLVEFLCPDYNLFLFDFRGMGESQGKISTIGLKETDDLNSAVEYLKNRGIEKIGAFGFSMGAAVIIMSNNPDISAIVSDSSFSDLDSVIDMVFAHLGPFKWFLKNLVKFWSRVLLKMDINNVSPLNNVQKLKSPVLFIHGEMDTQIPPSHGRRLYEKAFAAGVNVSLWIVSGADHGEVFSAYGPEYAFRVKEFFKRFLGLNLAHS